jgi:hypothetical protein
MSTRGRPGLHRVSEAAGSLCGEELSVLPEVAVILLLKQTPCLTPSRCLRLLLVLAVAVVVLGGAIPAHAASARGEKLLRVGLDLSEKTHYVEALDLLEEARDTLEAEGVTQTALYGDVLYALAETRIKGRLHQSFPAQYVKSALKEVQLANKVRERLRDLPPRKLAEGFFVEGYIQKKFFKRTSEALVCLEKAVNVDPGFAAAKRELGELILSKETHKGDL